jgi:hypothetical protein
VFGDPLSRDGPWTRQGTQTAEVAQMAVIQFFPVPAGEFNVTNVLDVNGAPANVLEASQPFDVEGEIVINAGNAITGTATVRLYADQLGGPIDQEIGNAANVAIDGDGTFPWTVNVPANTLPDAPSGDSNLYQLAAVLKMVNSANKPTNITAHEVIGTFTIG